MICPNHQTEQKEVSQASDGIFLRPRLACGCTPSNEECGQSLTFAHFPDEIPGPTIEIEVPQVDPQAMEQDIRRIVNQIIDEAAAKGIDLTKAIDVPAKEIDV